MNPGSRGNRSELVWNFFSILVLLGILAVAVVVLLIYLNPQSELNPLRPPTLPARLVLLTNTPDPGSSIPYNSMPTGTQALVTQSLNITEPTSTQPLPVSIPEEVAPQEYDFSIQPPITAIAASQYNPSLGCDWMGVAGQVFDLQGTPLRGIRLSLVGELDGIQIDMISMTGTALQYGQAGYEFYLGNKNIASSGKLRIQLMDQAGLPLSDRITFDTSGACEQNLVLINFKEER